MQCLNCGSDIGNDLGLCESCRRTESLIRNEILKAVSSPINHPSVFALYGRQLSLVVGLGILSFIAYSSFHRPPPAGFVFSNESSHIFVRDEKDESYAEYLIGPDITLSRVLLDRWEEPRDGAFFAAGVFAEDLVMSKQDYTTVLEKRKTGACQASFLSSNTEQIRLVSSDVSFSQGILRTRMNEGTEIEMEGNFLRLVKLVVSNVERPTKSSDLFFFPTRFTAQGNTWIQMRLDRLSSH